MIRALVTRILLLLACLTASAETLDEAIASLARKVSARLAPAETARITSRSISSLPAAEVTRTRNAFTRALQRRPRNPKPIDVVLTISENVRGFLLVAELRRETETLVDLAPFTVDPPAKPSRPGFALRSALLWEQATPILDLAILGNGIMILDTDGVSQYERIAGKWERKILAEAPVVSRDPRGKLEVGGDSFTCSTNTELEGDTRCSGGRFKPGGNIQNLQDWRGDFFASVEVGTDILVAEQDGRVHVYDSEHRARGSFEGWGDMVALRACGGSQVVVSLSGDATASDSIALYELVNRTPARLSEPLEFAGPVTALWPSGEGAVAVVRNLTTGDYAAYSLTVDCSR